MSKSSGFTEAELAAFEWSKKQKDLEESKRKDRSRDKSRKKERGRRYRDSSPDSSHHGSRSPSRDRSRHSRRKRSRRSPSTSRSSSSGRSRSRDRNGHKRDLHRRRYTRSSSGSRSLSPETRRRKRSFSHSSTDSSRSRGGLPKDPFNPLNLAYRDGRRHSKGSHREDREKRMEDEERWKHDLYESDGERASHEAEFRRKNREQKNIKESQRKDENLRNWLGSAGYKGSDSEGESKPKLITKRGWKSRAGGVYIPGDEDEDDLYYDYTRTRSRSYERPDPSYTLD